MSARTYKKRRSGAPKRSGSGGKDGTPVSTSRVVNNVVRVHVVVHRAHSLPNTSFMSKQHPYVVATLLPYQWTQRTKICYSGGSAPEWGLQQDNHMYFEPKEGSLGQLTHAHWPRIAPPSGVCGRLTSRALMVPRASS